MRRSLGQTAIASEDALLPAPCADGSDVRESESRLRQVVESAESVFILYQLHPPAYLYISPNCSTLLGLDESQLLANMNWLVHVDDQARIESDYRAAVVVGQRAQAEYRIVRPDGEVRWIRSTATPVLNELGRTERMAITLEDIGDRVNTAAALGEAEATAWAANEAKNKFLSRMSHELRTPLNAVLGFAQLLEIELGEDPRVETVGQILRSGRCLLDLINDDFDIPRIEAGETFLSVEPVPLGPLIDEAMQVMAPLAESAAVTLMQTFSPAGCLALADRHRLRQILLNLLSNAVKYNRPGGRVWVERRIFQNEVAITVNDDGPGIPIEMHDRMFTPLDRLGAEAGTVEGTGIGLALTRSLTELMDGSLTVDSVVGRGSAFTVTLPRAMMSSGPSGVDDGESGDPGTECGTPAGTYTLLYIEDNEPNVLVVEHVLKLRPTWRLIHAALGRLGVELARAHQPQMVLLDLHLPDGSGHDVLKTLRTDPATRALPVVILTADAALSQQQAVLAEGATRCMTKPLAVPEMLDLLDEYGHGQAGGEK
jgi:PAS domain S-box-containing protein